MLLTAYCGRRLIAVLAFAALGGPTIVEGTQASSSGDPSLIAWERSFATAQKRARAEGRPLLVDFWAAWCHWCHELDSTTYRDRSVAAAAREFVAVKVDTEGSLAEAELAARYEVEILPSIGFLSPQGRLFLRRDRFEGPETFLATLGTARDLAARVVAWEARLARNGDDAEALAGLGALLVEQASLRDGRELLQRARKRDGARPGSERKRTRWLLALAERQRGKDAAARDLLREALALQPPSQQDDERARELLAKPAPETPAQSGSD